MPCPAPPVQEERLKQLVLCQFAAALACLKQGGSFVCKVFDTFTPFVVGLVYILYRHFDVCIPGRCNARGKEMTVAC
jgi:23S rRNA U2552 (ribose-2'-O)-methylase RlmE/FtsJ